MTHRFLVRAPPPRAGMALGRRWVRKATISPILGIGNSMEGQVWEMATFAKQHGLDNPITFVDWNHQQLDGYTEDICNSNIETRLKPLV